LQICAAQSEFLTDRSEPLLTVIVNGAWYFCGARMTESCTTCTTSIESHIVFYTQRWQYDGTRSGALEAGGQRL
jgi:hypothetical protein